MDQERWKQVRAIFDSAIEQPTSERVAFLTRACGGDGELEQEVVSLLDSYNKDTDDFLEHPVAPPHSFKLKIRDSNDGRMIGPYRILRSIGKGGMGTVYAATRADNQFQKLVAIKLVRHDMDSENILRRFRKERQVLAGLDHPNIARFLDGGTTDEGLPYLVMEYVEGIPIDRYCEANSLSILARLQLFGSVCSAVQLAHQNLVVHRDLKPGNILVTPAGIPKLLDFGIAKLLRPEYSNEGIELTLTDSRPMTPDYASPEQLRGEPITTASDIYSLGVILYRLLTGVSPYRVKSSTISDLERAILHEPVERPSAAITRTSGDAQAKARGSTDQRRLHLPNDLDAIVLMALRKEPNRRYATADQFAEDVRNFAAGRPVIAQPDTRRYRLRKFVGRNKAAVAAGALIVLSLAAATAVTSISLRREQARFQQVRELANYFIFDLDAKIRSGQTAARKAMVERGLIYLNSLAKESSGDPKLQLDIIRGYIRIGDLQGNPFLSNLGDERAARSSYEEALHLVEPLHKSDPADKNARFYLALVNASLGRLALARGENKEAIQYFEKARSAYEALAGDFVQAKSNLPRVYDSIGNAHDAQGNLSLALENWEQFRQLTAEQLAARPAELSLRIGAAQSNLKVANALVRSERYQSGVDRLNEALATLQQGGESPIAKRTMGRVYSGLGEAYAGMKDYSRAIANHRSALRITESLLASDPENKQPKYDLPYDLGHLSAELAHSGETREARTLARRALEVLRPLAEEPRPQRNDLYLYCWLLINTPFRDLTSPHTNLALARKLAGPGESDPDVLDLLGRAQYEAGEVNQAIATEQKALDLLASGGNPKLRAELQQRMNAFREGAARNR